MCRIAGIIDKNLAFEEIEASVKSMCTIMAHGGPDGAGFFFNKENGIAFGHRRLAIIDLSTAGEQPMHYNDGELVITYNGEIFNFTELKAALIELGLTFKSHCDTEVILAAYAAWGTKSFEKLKGMFAFALYDAKKNLSFLVRDASGIKPLYYAHLQQQLVFASEIRAFKKISPFYTENPDWKVYFLAFGHIPEPYTTLSDVQILPKGKYLTWNHQTSSFNIHSFLNEKHPEQVNGKDEAKEIISNSLKKAIQAHLLADAPIGVFLSGGIDSSLISLLANEQTALQENNYLNTLSINFEDTTFSEKPYQDIVSSKIHGKHQEYTITESNFNALFPTALKAMDQPTTDGINSWFINYFAKQNGLKAVLSGIGADELFGGYPSFKRMNLVNLLSKLPGVFLKSAINLNKPALKRIYYLSYKNTVGHYLFLRGIFDPKEIAALLNRSVKEVDQVLKNMKVDAMPANLKPEEQASWLESNMYMQNQLLKDTDSMSMQHGIEVRVPFLDQDLICALAQINHAIKFKGDKPKSLLVNTFINFLPDKIWNRPKMGFTFPFQKWLKENQPFLNQLTLNNNKKAMQLTDDFKQGKLHWSKAMALYVTSSFEK
ncbi:asparagine synthase (glutamine-hydrolyzing) [Pedobacter nototheniae]|uniref:asparagine synthase (glutamine-hydrolyzing) n=1 Tax=Pedobacter nototheniae TaxID=2488994 RepID=UPI00292EA295|nr:asparagine synthase (glutamine-hydrolyzing) [Pedobacter nototheniae]